MYDFQYTFCIGVVPLRAVDVKPIIPASLLVPVHVSSVVHVMLANHDPVLKGGAVLQLGEGGVGISSQHGLESCGVNISHVISWDISTF